MTSPLLDHLERFSQIQPDRKAIASESYSTSYIGLLSTLKKICSVLQSAGLGQASTVGIHIEDEVAHFQATLALLIIGSRQVVLPSYEPLPINKSIAEEIGVDIVLSDTIDFRLPGVRKVLWSTIHTTQHSEASENSERVTSEGRVVIRTSGSTGRPKAFELTESQLADQARRLTYQDQRMLRLAPIESNGSKRQRIFCAFGGGVNVFRPSSDSNFVSFCLEHDVSWIDASRVQISSLLHLDHISKLSGVSIQSSGMEVPFRIRKALMENVSPKLHIRYATTEVGTISIAGPSDHDQDEGVGSILDGVSVEIVGSDQQPVSPGSLGEIRIKAPGMASEYINNPEETKKRFFKGWFYPGDMGHIRDDGELVIDGRKDHMIILNGINIYPSEIERVAESHPDVSAAAAFGLPSDIHGQIPVVLVTVKNKDLGKKALREYCRKHLGVRSPRQIAITFDDLPRYITGKINRPELPDLFLKLLKNDRNRS